MIVGGSMCHFRGLLMFHVGDMSCSGFFLSFYFSPPVVPRVYSLHNFEGLCYLHMGDPRGIPK
jgi:hypothetical protein